MKKSFEFEIRGGAWADIMNSCFWEYVAKLDGGYILCRDRADGKLFAMYAPGYDE